MKSSSFSKLFDEFDIIMSPKEESSRFLRSIDVVGLMSAEIIKIDADVERKQRPRSRGIEFARLQRSSWEAVGERYLGWFNSAFEYEHEHEHGHGHKYEYEYESNTGTVKKQRYKWMHCKKEAGIRLVLTVNLKRKSLNYVIEKLLVTRSGDDPYRVILQFWVT